MASYVIEAGLTVRLEWVCCWKGEVDMRLPLPWFGRQGQQHEMEQKGIGVLTACAICGAQDATALRLRDWSLP